VPRYNDETIAEALDKVARRKYVLPAIQREFVWNPPQICVLFDSIMRGYPINSFLYWEVAKDSADAYRFYDFVLDYHELNAPGCPPHKGLPPEDRIAVLDGQQRLTALNIGLRGSHAERARYKWVGKPQNYPQKFLYLDICAAPQEADDRAEELAYRFDFLTAEDAEAKSDIAADVHWFPVSDIFEVPAGQHAMELLRRVQELQLGNHRSASQTLFSLWDAVHNRPHISYYLEKEQDLDRVLDIFVRVNSQGDPLSHSDLLMSVATAQWTTRDARQAIPRTLEDMNRIGGGFAFSRDNVLKAGLVLIGVSDIGFKARNFNRENMARLETEWDSISATLTRSVELLSSFGLSATSIRANNVLIPVAYYLHRRRLDDSYLTSSKHLDDRDRVRDWTLRALIRPGVWGSGPDTLLGRLRNAIDVHGESGFPSAAIEAEMAALGKSLRFDEGLVEALVDSRYGESVVVPLLSILYGKTIDTGQSFHEDHVFPRVKFRRDDLRKVGYSEEEVERIVGVCRDSLANLQLLEGAENLAKREKLPLQWAHDRYTVQGTLDKTALDNYLIVNDMRDLPEDLRGFLGFFEARRERMRRRLLSVLGSEPGTLVGEAAVGMDESPAMVA
jgi:hypothetical protein